MNQESVEIKTGQFEGWAMVEMMGHRKEIGYVTTQAFGAAVLFRVDTPDLPEREYVLERPEWVGDIYCPKGATVKRAAWPARSCLVAPASLYAINPCDEATARKAIEQTFRPPLMVVSLPEGKALPPAEDPDDEPEDGGDFLDEDEL